MPDRVKLPAVKVTPALGPAKVKHGCRSWTIRKTECQRIDAFKLVLEKTLESLLDCKKIQPVQPKEISPEYSLEGLMLKLKLQYFDVKN